VESGSIEVGIVTDRGRPFFSSRLSAQNIPASSGRIAEASERFQGTGQSFPPPHESNTMFASLT